MVPIKSVTIPIGALLSTHVPLCFTHPIVFAVRFRDPVTALECDISVNNLLGITNSELLRAYCDAFPTLRSMIKIIKLWAKRLGLNDPSGSGGGGTTFSSYCLSIMTVAFLQVGLQRLQLLKLITLTDYHPKELNLLPTLQDLPDLPIDASEGWFWTKLKGDQRVRCDTRFRDVKSTIAPRSTDDSHTLDSLMTSWFK